MASVWLEIYNPENQNKEEMEAKIDQIYTEKDKNVPKITIFLARNIIKNLQKKHE